MKKKIVIKKKIQKKQDGGPVFDTSKLTAEQLKRYNALDPQGKTSFEQNYLEGNVDEAGNISGTLGAKNLKNVKTANAIGAVGDLAAEGIGAIQSDRAAKGKEPSIGLSAGKGALKGAAEGAAIGSVIPGIGTAIGAVGGALAGATIGNIKGIKAKKDYIANKTAEQLAAKEPYMEKFKSGGKIISSAKARKILRDGTVYGKPLTDKQKRFFGAQIGKAYGGKIIKKRSGGKVTRNFKSNEAYKKWLAYGHIHGTFAKSPGNTPVKIKGKSKKVKHSK